MTRYLKPAVVVDAVQWTGDNADEVRALVGAENFGVIHPDDREDDADGELLTTKHATWEPVFRGDWVVRDVNRGLSVCREDDFAEFEAYP